MNKRIVLFLAVVLCSASLSAQDSGINFKHEAWAEVLAQAAKESKLIFVDAYTTWCGPCKKMTKEIFPQKKVGDFFNKNFINVKMDMEKGEGPTVAGQYDVIVYPTLLFLAPDGTLVHRSAGYHTADQFMELGSIALDPLRRLSAMDSRYASGDRSAEFLYTYTLSRFEAQDGSHAPIAAEYMTTQTDWSTDENMQFIFAFTTDTDSKMFDYLIDNRKAFGDSFGTRAVTAKIQQLIYDKVYDSADNSSIDQVSALFKRAYPEKADQLTMRFKMAYYRQAGDRQGYANAAVTYFDKYDGEADELNEAAWTFFRVIKDKKMLKKAVKWSKSAIKQENIYYNNDTLASLYHKLGKKCKARKAAEKAIELGRAEGVDYSETEKLLAEIKS